MPYISFRSFVKGQEYLASPTVPRKPPVADGFSNLEAFAKDKKNVNVCTHMCTRACVFL